MSDVTTDPITHTLELVAEKHGDPTELVYKRLLSERTNHQHIGVPPETFDTFFTTIAGTFKDILQNDWTPEMDEAWNELLANLTKAVHAEQ